MNDELITRLRARHEACPFPSEPSLYSDAADALEAAQAELESVRGQGVALNLVAAKKTVTIRALRAELTLAEMDAADMQAERDAEAALADRAASSNERLLHVLELVLSRKPARNVDEAIAEAEAVLAAHRERRTTPTKDGDQ